jgi:hypothetical protein
MDDKENPAVEKSADKVNEAVEEITVKAADATIGVQINFDIPAALRKWPSRAKERATSSIYAGPYLLFEGTLDECIGQFMSKPASQHHLYEIHTAPQSDLVRAVVSAEHIVELARLRDLFRAV